PGLLQEFELAFDVGAKAHEEQAGLLSRFGHILTADARNAVPVRDRDLISVAGIEAVERIGAADMRAERTALGFGILGAEQAMIVGPDRPFMRHGLRCARIC